jgi:hypothetical protein
MNKQKQWIISRIRMGWMFLAVGVIVILFGIFAQSQFAYQPYNMRIISGLGILLAGIGIGSLVKYSTALKDDESARRLTVEERDERTVLLRTRAGNRAFWVSTAIVYIGLMWVSFAANGSLPPLSGNTLWFFFIAAVLIPFGVYIGSILIDQRNI